MNKAEIYYFSGTGNSYAIAKQIGNTINADLIPIANCIEYDEITADADSIGIVFPVYYMNIPVIISNFLKKLKTKDNVYFYAVSNYGGGQGISRREIEKLLNEKNITLSAFYGIHMPQNAFSKPFENHDKILSSSQKMIKLISDNHSKRKTGRFYSSYTLNAIQAMVMPFLDNTIKKDLTEKVGMDINYPLDKAIHLQDKLMTVNNKCNGCGICSKVCPVNNIEIKNNSPIWKHSCENCLACYNFCPQHAIDFGLLVKPYYYLHPDYTIKDAIDNSL